MKLKLSVLCLFSFILILSCGGDEECNSTDLTYNNGISTILNTSCASSACHGEGTTTTFEMYNYATTTAVDNARIIGAINHDAGFIPMPLPQGADKLSDCDIEKITAWINDGSPE